MHRCVELWSIECVRDKVRDTDSDYVMTREMQGIVGQASNFELRGQLSAFCARERLSQSSTELSCRRFDEERSKKSKAIDDQRCGTVFCVHISPRTTSTVVRVQVVGVSKVRSLRWRACQDSLSRWTQLVLAKKEDER